VAQADARPFGKYQLLEKIAAGGMAEIYRAQFSAAAGVTKPLVIKKILPAYADNPSFVSMFINEAKIAVGLSHGNIAQVFDFGEINGEYYLAMELVHGQPLSKVLKRAKALSIPALPIPYALLIASEMCKGLHYAHTRLDERKKPLDIIHRDVSPQNVILSYEGQVKVVDFGIAKARTAGRTETEAGSVKGKYLYFSPEQARGKPLDARTDVFATAVVLYESLCGRLPFQGKLIEVLGAIVRAEFPSPRTLNPEIPTALEEILLTAMAADRDQRYPDAQAFGEALTHYLYSFAPSFSASSLQHLMTFLFEKELLAEGAPIRHSPELLEQVPLWQRALPGASATGSTAPETAVARSRGRSGRERPLSQKTPLPASKSRSKVPLPKAPPSPPLPRWVFIGLPVLTTLVALLAVLVFLRPATFAIQLGSDPAGASVSLDGKLVAKVTPTLLEGLAANQVHHLELRAPGMKLWSEDLQQERGVTAQVFAQLVPDRPTVALPVAKAIPVPKKPEAPTPPVEPVKYDASYPVNQIKLLAKEHVLSIPESNAAHLKLDPKRSYRIWAEGKIGLGGALDMANFTHAMYFVAGDAQLAAKDSYGIVGAKPLTLRHATALYAFILDDTPDDNTGALQIHVEDRTTRRVSTLLVDGRAHAVLPSSRAFLLRGLTAISHYEIRVLEGHPSAHTRPGKLGEVGKVAYLQNAGWQIGMGRSTSDASLQVLEAGRSYVVTGATWARFVFLDGSADDNSGELEIEVVPKAGGGGYLQGLGGR